MPCMGVIVKVLAFMLSLTVCYGAHHRRDLIASSPSSGGSFPLTITPTLWVDAKQGTDGGYTDGQVCIGFTNYGSWTGTFYQNPSDGNHTFVYRTNSGGCWGVTNLGGTADIYIYSPTNFYPTFSSQDTYTIAARIWNFKAPHFIRMFRGTAGTTYPVFCITGGQVFSQQGASSTISTNLPAGYTNNWMNLITTVTNSLGVIYLEGTNIIQGTLNKLQDNTAFGNRIFEGNDDNEYYYMKRILVFNRGLTASEVLQLNSWMTSSTP